ncbi:polyprenyl synthetase family protein [Streptomyces sp. S465]|uniref:polyprenyl synthetase family protein n=1 Tax=Streptomyces sp. S465 TaxID=2979468 RepID=UPI0022A866D7|nr:polyprenyl synthetase family protein [Streptomyces sp. S465]WAP56900.1 polyprenyl synthetase family protein [Streptomyces sp. S465]
MQPTVRDRALADGLRAAQAAVEEGLSRATESDVPFITEAARELTRTAGRRFRPLLVLLAARFGDPGAPGVVPAAVVVELTHLATHYHDGVRDETAVRHGAPRPDTNWDSTVAVLTGDFLFARASHLLADLGPRAVRMQAEAFRRQVTGQILATTGPRDGRDPIEHHLEVLASRTGSLTAVSGQLGALASGADASVADALVRYGERLGVASHLADELAAPTGRRPTLPVLLLARADPELYALLTGPAEGAGYAEAVARLRTHPVLERAREETVRQADAARVALSPLPDCPARAALEALCETVAPTAPSSCG